MGICSSCGFAAPEGSLFCPRCGRTVVPPVSLVPSGYPPGPGVYPPGPLRGGAPGAPLAAPPPPDWIPPELGGRSMHCPRCNTLISSVAVVCPVCQGSIPGRGEAAVDGERPP